MPVRSPSAVTAQVCVLLFEIQTKTVFRKGLRISATADGVMSLLKGSDSAEVHIQRQQGGHCFDKLSAGDYVVAASAAQQLYGLTTPDQLGRSCSGSTINLIFGAAKGVNRSSASG